MALVAGDNVHGPVCDSAALDSGLTTTKTRDVVKCTSFCPWYCKREFSCTRCDVFVRNSHLSSVQ